MPQYMLFYYCHGDHKVQPGKFRPEQGTLPIPNSDVARAVGFCSSLFWFDGDTELFPFLAFLFTLQDFSLRKDDQSAYNSSESFITPFVSQPITFSKGNRKGVMTLIFWIKIMKQND